MTSYQSAGIAGPTGPYVIQSGERTGKILELLMFDDYRLLLWMFKTINRTSCIRKNKFHLHLEWLLKQGENRQPKMICPQCKEKPVKYFSVCYTGDLFSIASPYTCCDKGGCIDKIRAVAAGKEPKFLPFCFSIIATFPLKTDRERVVELFRKVFGLPNRLTRQTAFEFFRSP